MTVFLLDGEMMIIVCVSEISFIYLFILQAGPSKTTFLAISIFYFLLSC